LNGIFDLCQRIVESFIVKERAFDDGSAAAGLTRLVVLVIAAAVVAIEQFADRFGRLAIDDDGEFDELG
jgi:hypothetical protein